MNEVTHQTRSRFTYCSLPPGPVGLHSLGFTGPRMEAIIVNKSKWVNGTDLRYYFFDRDTDGDNVVLADGSTEWRTWTTDDAHRDLVRGAFESWKAVGLGLRFLEEGRREDAEVRIGFMLGDGSWSYLGKDVLERGTNERTMNFGWDLVHHRETPDRDTALHEIGHTFGLPHEHQNPYAGMVWDEERVYAEFARPPNSWSREKTDWNVIRKIPPDTVQGSSWDPDSIMHYPFEAGLILTPERYRTEALQPAGGMSPRDVTWARTFYPPMGDDPLPELVPFQSQQLSIGPGEQRDFTIRPTVTRPYTFQTFGQSDIVMVLFEDVEGTLRFLAGDDDSGEDRNATFEVKLFSERVYVVRIRLYYSSASGQTAAMMW